MTIITTTTVPGLKVILLLYSSKYRVKPAVLAGICILSFDMNPRNTG
jgi:hypothetical protein